MKKYYVEIEFKDGDTIVEDNYGEYYDSEEEAREAANYAVSCAQQGAEIFHMSNPVDNPYDESDYDDCEYSIVEVDV